MDETNQKPAVTANFGVQQSAVQWGFTIGFALLGGFLFARSGPEIVDLILKWVKSDVSYPLNNVALRIPFALLGAIVGVFVGSLIVRLVQGGDQRWKKLEEGQKVTAVLSIIIGLFAAVASITIFSAFTSDRRIVGLLVVVIWIVASASLIYALETMTEILPWYKGKGRAKRTGVKILDTNVIIDGRIYDVARTGFLEGQIYVPQFVLEELQYIADSHDALRRQRGKRGLEVLRHLQAEFPLEVGVHDKAAPEMQDGVDSRLVRLAKAIGGDLVTNDHNLNRVASLQDVRVLNLNDLSLSLRPNVLPQEHLTLAIVREGNQFGQGIGYLDDGTMVIVENGKNHIGITTEVMVTQVIQTERGKLIFAEVEGEDIARRKPSPRRQGS